MILSGAAIKQLLEKNELQITPTPIVKEASIKIHLAGQFGKTRDTLAISDKHVLPPKGFIVGKSKESITLPNNIAGLYDGYIGIATQGVFTHVSSTLIDPNFSGQITLEIYNASDTPVELTKDMRVGHVIFLQVTNSI